jgi:outer membrane protein assembly factor BamB
MRTGWNRHERSLTPATVGSPNFGMLFSVSLDATAAPQPLLANGIEFGNAGRHNAVYVATANNSVYAFDAGNGTLLVSVNLGAPPPPSAFPQAETVGITSTPVIDIRRGLIYVVSCTYENASVTYRLHALELSTLIDAIPPVVVSASARLANGAATQFQSDVQRQRPALLEANGNIYAAFGSFGDLKGDVTRGWLLGWDALSLVPLRTNELTNRLSSSPGDCYRQGSPPCFLSTIWMSGFGPAADRHGNVIFATANSDPGSYAPPKNVQESAVKISGDLSRVIDYFTPYQLNAWDEHDADFGSGGVTLFPSQPGPIPNMAVAAGKSGMMYLLNRDNMGKHVNGPPDNVITEVTIGRCWCGQSYFEGPDGIGRVVTSGGANVIVWKLLTSPDVALKRDSVSAALPSGQDPGFFTSVSSDGRAAHTAIVWAVTRPQTDGGSVTLLAINPVNGSTIFSSSFGSWPSANHNANLVPMVANGRVYVAVDTNLFAFGLGGGKVEAATSPGAEPRVASNEVYGTVESVRGSRFEIQTRSGQKLAVDASDAMKQHLSARIVVGGALGIDGHYDNSHTLHAQVIFRAKASPALWHADK